MRNVLVFSCLLGLALSASVKVKPLSPEQQRGIGRIVGGTNAADGEFPWQISLRLVAALGATHLCGGSVLNENYILTAGHCCTGFSAGLLHVVAGGTNLYVGEGVEQRRNVKKVIIHENYSGDPIDNDICLLQLTESLDLSGSGIQAVALPAQGQETPEGTNCIVTGWGTTSEGGASAATNLKKVTVPVVSDANCRLAYGDDAVADSMICAGFEEGGKDSCQGDSGGPFISEETKELLGIVSWGYGCARPSYPGVYTEVSYYVDWIAQNTV